MDGISNTEKIKNDIISAANSGRNGEDGFKVDTEYADSLPETSEEDKKPSTAEEIFEWLDVLATAIITVVIIFSLLFRVATISGPSMQNTLFTGDKVIISNLGYTPKCGDIVVVSRNINNSVEDTATSKEPIIKRVIAVGGQTVDIDFERGVVSVDGVELDELSMSNDDLAAIDRVYMVACGTSYHVSLIARELVQDWAKTPVFCEYASELNYKEPLVTDHTLCVIITQSGETADTLTAAIWPSDTGTRRHWALMTGVFAITISVLSAFRLPQILRGSCSLFSSSPPI